VPLPDRFGSGIDSIPVSRPQVVETLGTKVLVAKPWQKSVHPLTAFSVGQLCDRRRTADLLNFGDAFVVHSRNKCADALLQSKLEWMLTIDDDMIIPFGDAKWYRNATGFNFPDPFAGFNALDRLLSANKTVVGALYSGRYPTSSLMYNEGGQTEDAAWARKGPHDIVKPTRWVATGCLLTHRSVYEDIEKRFPRLARAGDGRGGQWFTSTEASLVDRVQSIRDRMLDGPITAEKCYKVLEGLESALAEAKYENPLGCGEDVAFCLRASAAGHQPHVDMGLVCGHIGHCVYGLHNTGLKSTKV
jgi:hypothetical protein